MAAPRPPIYCALALAPLLAAACAGAPVRGDGRPEVAELQGQLKAQSALIAEQQRRIEQLEVRLAALAARLAEKAKAPAPAAADKAPAASAPANPAIESSGDAASKQAAEAAVPKKLHTVKLEPPRPAKGRRPRTIPSDRAPRLPTATNLKEPEESDLARLDEPAPRPRSRQPVDPGRDVAQADVAFAQAVQRFNEGDRAGAQRDLLAFAARHPQHAAADNAIYLAGLASAQSGDCPAALQHFERVWLDYPAGDAVPGARLEHARCLLRLGRGAEARAALEALEKDHPDVPEATQARALLNGL